MTTGPNAELKSARFRREREASWRRLEQLLERRDKNGLESLTDAERREMPMLYRATLSSLSVARSIALDRTLVIYLEALAGRAYFEIYGPRVKFSTIVADFLHRDLPQAVRANAPLLALAAAVSALGACIGWYLVITDPDNFLGIVPPDLAGGRSPYMGAERLRASLYNGASIADLNAFALFLFRHNAMVAIMAFGLGFALGIPTIGLLFYNGAILGAFYAAFARYNLGFELSAWLSVNGTTEVLAIILAGTGGLALARGALFPAHRQTRLVSMAEHGRTAGLIGVGAIGMLAIAAVLEGLVRPLVKEPGARLAIGCGFALIWLIYFLRAGREGEDAP